MVEENQPRIIDTVECECGTDISNNEGYSFNGRLFCKECYFKEGKLGPMHEQYKECHNCGQTVHVFTIRCSNCNSPVHETGTISTKKPIRTSVILTYGILSLIIVVSALTIPGFSDKGLLAWVSTLFGMIFAVHGLLGVMFFFVPFGFKTLYKLNAFLLGFSETALGFFLLSWPKL
jgi:hypothetical protein